MKPYQHYINGGWAEPTSGDRFDTTNPYTGEVWAKIPHGNPADVDAAVAAAKAAFENGWADMRPSTRGRLIYQLADLIERDASHLAEIEVRDNGKSRTGKSRTEKQIKDSRKTRTGHPQCRTHKDRTSGHTRTGHPQCTHVMRTHKDRTSTMYPRHGCPNATSMCSGKTA